MIPQKKSARGVRSYLNRKTRRFNAMSMSTIAFKKLELSGAASKAVIGT